jgi:hypothetical protein
LQHESKPALKISLNERKNVRISLIFFFESNWINSNFGRVASNPANPAEKRKISPKNRPIKIEKRQRSKNKTTEAPACFGSTGSTATEVQVSGNRRQKYEVRSKKATV